MPKSNRNFKDSLFKDYFRDRGRLIEAYNAIAGKDYPPTAGLEFRALKNVLFKSQVNDIAFTLDGRLVVLLEAQSTINENMALRMLEYMGEVYKGLVDQDLLYRKKMVKIPAPEFFVLYHGLDEFPGKAEKAVLRLSDAFMEKRAEPCLELVVTVYDIAEGKSAEMLGRSGALSDYARFISVAYENLGRAETKPQRDEAIKKTIDYCLENGIMKTYLLKRGSEVRRMLSLEWNDEVYRRVLLEEGEEKGRIEGEEKGRIEGEEKGLSKGRIEGVLEIARNMKAEGSETTFIMKVTGLSEEEVEAL